jgi:hypothetical protein
LGYQPTAVGRDLDLAAALGLPPHLPAAAVQASLAFAGAPANCTGTATDLLLAATGVERCQPDSTSSTQPAPPPEVDLAGLADDRLARTRGRPADAGRTRRA